jgi:hypothetical protein
VKRFSSGAPPPTVCDLHQSTDFPNSRLLPNQPTELDLSCQNDQRHPEGIATECSRNAALYVRIGCLWPCSHGHVLLFTGALASGLVSSDTASRSLSSLSKGATIFSAAPHKLSLKMKT